VKSSCSAKNVVDVRYSHTSFPTFFSHARRTGSASRIARGCSIFKPSMSQRYCRSVRVLIASLLLGRSNRLYRRTNPSPSQYKALIRSFRFPQKRNRLRLNGSSENSSFTRSANPSIPFLRSVYPQATYICSACVKSFSMRTPGV